MSTKKCSTRKAASTIDFSTLNGMCSLLRLQLVTRHYFRTLSILLQSWWNSLIWSTCTSTCYVLQQRTPNSTISRCFWMSSPTCWCTISIYPGQSARHSKERYAYLYRYSHNWEHAVRLSPRKVSCASPIFYSTHRPNLPIEM